MHARSATPRRRSGGRLAAAVVLGAAAVLAWVAFGLLLRATLDAPGREVLHVLYGRSSAWWSALSFAVAASVSFSVVTWLLGRAARRAPDRRRRLAVGAAGTVWLASGAALSAVAGLLVLLSAVSPIRTPVSGTGGSVLVTRDAFDGDVVQVWRRSARFTYVREPGPISVDPRSGACEVTNNGPDAVLSCGSTSQRLSPGPAS